MSGEKYSIPFYRQKKTTDVQQKLNSFARTLNRRKFNLVLSKSGAHSPSTTRTFYDGPQGITVVDFKTDHVYTDAEVQRRAAHYRPQLTAYSRALERVLEKEVCRRVLCFLNAGKTVEV